MVCIFFAVRLLEYTDNVSASGVTGRRGTLRGLRARVTTYHSLASLGLKPKAVGRFRLDHAHPIAHAHLRFFFSRILQFEFLSHHVGMWVSKFEIGGEIAKRELFGRVGTGA